VQRQENKLLRTFEEVDAEEDEENGYMSDGSLQFETDIGETNPELHVI
jgi:hypothetical protein